MNWVDIVIFAAIAVSALISIWRGFTREAVSLAGWVTAFWVAFTLADKLEGLLGGIITIPSLRLVASFLVLFLATLVMASLVGFLTSQLIKRTGLTGLDRAIGILFGMARGFLIVVMLVLAAGLTPLPQDGWWKASFLLPYFENIALWAGGFLPESVAGNLRY